MAETIISAPIDTIQIPKKLGKQILQGFDTIYDAHTFRFLHKRASSVPTSKFPDLTGFECYVNEIGLNSDDHVHHTILGMEILIAVLNAWAKLDQGLVMRAILSAGSEFTHLTFHVVRSNEIYLDDDLESYNQPLMTCDSGSSINNLSDLKKIAFASPLKTEAKNSRRQQ